MPDEKVNIQQNTFIPEGVIEFDENGDITFCSDAILQITGYSPEEIVADKAEKLFADYQAFHENLSKTLSEGISYTRYIVNIQCKDRKEVDLSGSLFPLILSDKKIKGAAFVFQDKSKKRALYDLLEEKTLDLTLERNKLHAIFNSRIEGTFTVDKDCRITAFNRSAERITGYKSEEVYGRQCWQVLKAGFCKQGCPIFEQTDKSSATAEISVKETYLTNIKGSRIPIRLNIAPLVDEEGKVMGRVNTFQDITELKNLTNHLNDKFQLSNIIGKSKSMDKVYRLMENVSKSDSTILLTGESGTGKELVGRAIHLNSYRRSQPFVAINCSAFVETLLESELFGHERGAFTGAIQTKQGRFELAEGGTLFLDEIGDISPTVQVKLLRVLETRQFERVGGTKPIKMDVRLIAATNKNLIEKVDNDQFREDFYYRIYVVNIHLPPLRERMEDLPLLLHNLLKKYSSKFNKYIVRISPQAMKILNDYNWPGNIRELENLMEYAFVMCQSISIEVEHLPEKIISQYHDGISIDEIDTSVSPLDTAEKILIYKTLKNNNGHRGKTAKALGIDTSTLWRKMKKFQLL